MDHTLSGCTMKSLFLYFCCSFDVKIERAFLARMMCIERDRLIDKTIAGQRCLVILKISFICDVWNMCAFVFDYLCIVF